MRATRRTFMAMLGALTMLPTCALHSKPLASISGHVTGTGLRFGRTTEHNPEGRYPVEYVMPGAPVTLRRHIYKPAHDLVIDKVLSDALGYFQFKNIPGGDYFITSPGANTMLVIVSQAKPYYLGSLKR